MTQPHVLVSDKTAPDALELLGSFARVTYDPEITPEALLAGIGAFDAIMVRSRTKVTRAVIAASNLKAIGRIGVGLDNIDTDAAKEKGIAVFNAADAPAPSVAELAMGMALSLARSLHKAHAEMRRGVWNKNAYNGWELLGKTAGVIGGGFIGTEFIKRAHAFGMNVLVFDPYREPDAYRAWGGRLVDLDTLLAASDVISLHIPKTKETAGLLSTRQFGLMKKTAIVINCARGGVVDENALCDAIEAGTIAGAALDVFEVEPTTNERLTKLPEERMLLTPHIGAATNEAQSRAGTNVVDKLRAFFTAS